MNPPAHDGTAEKLAKQIGMAEGALTGQQRLVVEPTELTGPEYSESVIVFGVSSKPARVNKVMAYREKFFRERMGQKKTETTAQD